MTIGVGAASLLLDCDGNRGGGLLDDPSSELSASIRVIPVPLVGTCLLSIFSLLLVVIFVFAGVYFRCLVVICGGYGGYGKF